MPREFPLKTILYYTLSIRIPDFRFDFNSHSKAQAQGLGPISEVDLTNTLELSFLYQDRIRIVLGTTNDLDYKIKWAWEMVTPGQTSDSLGEEERGTLDVSSRGEDGLGRARWRAGVL